jgi:hypothetical protein
MSSGLPKSVEDLLKASVEAHYVLASALILVLVLLVLYLFFRKEKYGGGPTSMIKGMSQEQVNVGRTASENYEKAEGGKDMPAAAQSGPKEGSAAWNVLHSSDFHCDTRDPVSDDAWGWMVGHSKDAESMIGSPSDLTAIMAGQRPPQRGANRR